MKSTSLHKDFLKLFQKRNKQYIPFLCRNYEVFGYFQVLLRCQQLGEKNSEPYIINRYNLCGLHLILRKQMCIWEFFHERQWISLSRANISTDYNTGETMTSPFEYVVIFIDSKCNFIAAYIYICMYINLSWVISSYFLPERLIKIPTIQ